MNSTSRPGRMVLEASLKTAMLMLLSPTPRTEEAPPGPGSQILPTPGHTPLELDADVAAAAVVDEAAMYDPAIIMDRHGQRQCRLRKPTQSLADHPHTLPL